MAKSAGLELPGDLREMQARNSSRLNFALLPLDKLAGSISLNGQASRELASARASKRKINCFSSSSLEAQSETSGHCSLSWPVGQPASQLDLRGLVFSVNAGERQPRNWEESDSREL